MNWQQVCEHPDLRNLPFKIELNETGKIIMSPVNFNHSLFQGEIAFILRTLLPNGKAIPGCAIKTCKGAKAADVAWVSSKLINKLKSLSEITIAPEICVEVISPSNTNQEMKEKRRLYFEVGAKEVWICNEQGKMCFFNAQQQLIHSKLAPEFPTKIEI